MRVIDFLQRARVGAVALLIMGLSICSFGALADDSSEKKEDSAEAAAAEKTEEEMFKVPDFIESGNPMSGDVAAMKEGQRLYFKWCAACHGAKADGVSRFGSYAADLTKYWRGYGEFVAIVLNGRVKKQMPPWKDVLNVEEISQVGAFLEIHSVEGAIWK